jgi:hypothetical protein
MYTSVWGCIRPWGGVYKLDGVSHMYISVRWISCTLSSASAVRKVSVDVCVCVNILILGVYV